MPANARIMRAEEAAHYLGYERPTAAFYKRVNALGIRPLWAGAYDRMAVDAAIDKASGLLEEDPNGANEWDAITERAL